jgi:hypothetical protein
MKDFADLFQSHRETCNLSLPRPRALLESNLLNFLVIEFSGLFDKLTKIDYIKTKSNRYEREPALEEQSLKEQIPQILQRAQETAQRVAERVGFTYEPIHLRELGEGYQPTRTVKETKGEQPVQGKGNAPDGDRTETDLEEIRPEPEETVSGGPKASRGRFRSKCYFPKVSQRNTS